MSLMVLEKTMDQDHQAHLAPVRSINVVNQSQYSKKT
jgi:hypothetical protein